MHEEYQIQCHLIHTLKDLQMKREIGLGGQGGNAARTIYQGHMPNPNVKLENVREPRLQYHKQDMEIGYEDKPAVLTYEGLEQKFMDEIIKLGKEQNVAEDAEHARHREKIMEINNQFQEKVSTLRALQAKRREEFLLKEAQSRLHQHRQAGMNHFPINQHPAAEAHHSYASSQFDSYRERTPFLGDGRNQQTEARVLTGQFDSYREGTPFLGGGRNQRTGARVPIPRGRVYNNARNY